MPSPSDYMGGGGGAGMPSMPGASPSGPTGTLAPPTSLASILGASSFPPLPQPMDPSQLNYTTETQDDGSVLLRLKNPDGTPGRVVKIVPSPIKGGGQKML